MTKLNALLRIGAMACALSVFVSLPAHAASIYASNFGTNTVTQYDAVTGAFVGTPVIAGPELNGLNGVRLGPDGSFFVAGQFTNNVVHYSSTGALLNVLDPANTAGLDSPQDLVFGPDGALYVTSSANDKILKYDAGTGAFLGVFADLSGNGHTGPIGVAFGPDGNLYVTTFDSGQVFRLNGQTGAILGSTSAPAGLALTVAAFGPDGNLYTGSLDLATFAGGVYRYNTTTNLLTLFVAPGSGGLQSPGGITFGPNGNLLVSNLLFDQNFVDTGSTILSYNGTTGAPIGTLVAAGHGLDTPFFLTAADVPEPSTGALLVLGVGLFACMIRARAR
jgi:streptogramin lyase